MAKFVKRHFLLSIVLFSLLLVFSVTSSLAAPVYFPKPTTQEKGLTILNNVVGIDLTKYTVASKEYPQDYQTSYFGVVPQENVGYDLTSGESKLKMLYTFAYGNLQMIQVLESEGSPKLVESASSPNALEMAKYFLINYQTYTADSFFGELKSMLDNVDATKNATIKSGNVQLEVTAINDYITFNDYTNFKWTYTFNDAKASSKFVALGFKNGFLTAFVDNWRLYKIGSTTVNLSKEEAIDIALETAKSHSWSVKLDDDAFEAKNFNESNACWAVLVFDSSVGAGKTRSEDLLTLYPVWRVGVALDKWYGNLYGIEVDIWADTKEIRYVQEAFSTLLPPADGIATASESTASLNGQTSLVAETEPSSIIWVALPIIVAATIGTASFWVSRKKKSPPYNFPKLRSPKTGGISLCFLILFLMLLVPIATVNATQTGGAVVWGSESTGAGAYPNSWRKSSTEIDLQRYISNNIRNYFASNGYAGYNRQGYPGSLKSSILYYISYLQNNYDRVAVVDFDHGVGRTDYQGLNEWHYMFEDNVGTLTGDPPGDPHPENGVYDMDIHPLTTSRKIAFAFINTCLSANVSDWQYDPIDDIWWYSAQGMVNGRARGLPFAWTQRYVEWIYGKGFNVQTDISNYGYHYPDTGPQVYIGFPWGSASLEQRIPYNTGIQYQHWVNSFFYYALFYDMSVNDALDHASWQHWGAYFPDCPLWTGFQAYWWPSAWPQTNSRMFVYGNGEIHLKIAPPIQYSLSISAGSGGTTNPSPGTYWYDEGTNVQVTANPYAGYDFDYWLLDGGYYSSNPTVTVTMNSNHNLQAIFKQEQTGHQVTVYAYNQYGYQGYVPLYIDGQYKGTTPYTCTLSQGNHQIYVESPLYDGYYHVFQYYYYGSYNYNNPMTVYVGSSMGIVAYYYSYY